jgi:hypothetical protein
VRFNGLPGVIEEIDEDLLNLVRVDQCLRKVRIEIHDRFHIAGAELVKQDFHRRFDEAIDANSLPFGSTAAGEAEERLDDFLAAQCGLVHHRQIAFILGTHRSVLQQFGEAHHRSQGIIQFVGDAGHKFPDAGKLFALDQLRLRRLERLNGRLQLFA